MTPKVSVIMGIYNCAPYLQEALDSLYNQTFQDFEIILCDDGSSDNTYDIALQNSKQHHNIVLLKNEKNCGLNHTLNRCLKVARGKYIARMDGDDISLPTRFEKEVAFLDNHEDYAIVSTPMFYFDEAGIFRTGSGGHKPTKKDFIKGTPFCHAPCMVRQEAYRQVGGYSEDKRFMRVEDYHLWFKMYQKGFIGYVLEEPLYKMRDSHEAIKRRTFQNRWNEFRMKVLILQHFPCNIKDVPYVIRPLITYLLPTFLYNFLRRSKS